MSASIANLAREGATLDDVQGDIGNLHDLLEVIYGTVTDMDVSADRQEEKDRLLSLVWIARDIAKRANDEMDANSAVIAKAGRMVLAGAR